MDKKCRGVFIRNVRRSKGLSQAEVAKKAKTSRQNFCRIEKGGNMKMDLAQRICRVLRIEMGEITK